MLAEHVRLPGLPGLQEALSPSPHPPGVPFGQSMAGPSISAGRDTGFSAEHSEAHGVLPWGRLYLTELDLPWQLVAGRGCCALEVREDQIPVPLLRYPL